MDDRVGSVFFSVRLSPGTHAASLRIVLTPNTVEGIFTISVGLLIGLLLPGSPERPRPLFFEGLVRISESDGELLQQRIAADSPNKSYEPQHIHITPAKVWKTLSHWRRWPHLMSTSLVFSTWSSLTTYTPTIMMYASSHSSLSLQEPPWFTNLF